MISDEIADIFMFISVSIFAIGWMPQIYTIIKTKSVKDLSGWLIIANVVSMTLFMWSSIHYNDKSMYIPGSVCCLDLLILTVLSLLYKKTNSQEMTETLLT